ncbi:hypothetical protein K2173_013434 [Erythroxylum novogranatense]|uniref:Uncharacterized protein n=1 Tax=Erythroxylum novogranatense TaxID=1862640 RepID=A0AAV8SAC7_9ROSI|nr:hypothetical protein K2173_013434 [Erythroxylum novogranatense]
MNKINLHVVTSGLDVAARGAERLSCAAACFTPCEAIFSSSCEGIGHAKDDSEWMSISLLGITYGIDLRLRRRWIVVPRTLLELPGSSSEVTAISDIVLCYGFNYCDAMWIITGNVLAVHLYRGIRIGVNFGFSDVYPTVRGRYIKWSSVLGDRVEQPADLESVGASRESPVPHSEELPPRVPVRRERRYVQLRKQGAVDFYGNTDPAEAEGWLERTERVLDQMDCEPDERFDSRSSYY